MAEYRIPYGQGYQKLVLPDEYSVTMLTAAEAEPVANPRKAVADALAHPLGHGLTDYGQVDSAAIAINDKTRPVPLGDLLPPLLDCLHQMGLPPEKITLPDRNRHPRADAARGVRTRGPRRCPRPLPDLLARLR